MSISVPICATPAGWSRTAATRSVRGVQPRERAMLEQAAGDMYHGVRGDLTNEQFGDALGIDTSTAWRWVNGTVSTPLSRLGEQLVLFPRRGLPIEPLVAYVNLTALAATVERLSLAHVEAALDAAHIAETDAQAQFDPQQVRYLRRQPVCDITMARLALAHDARLVRVALLHHRRHQLRGH